MDQKIYVQIENKSLIPFFDLDKDSFRELNLTTIQDYQRTAIVTLYTRDSAGLDVQIKQYSIKPIPKAKAGVPKIGLTTRKHGYRKIGIELSLNGKQVIADRIRLPGAGRPLWILLLILLLALLLALLLGLGGYLLFAHSRADAPSSPAVRTQVPRASTVRSEPPSPAPSGPPAGQAAPSEPGVSPAAEGAPEPADSAEKQEESPSPAVPAQPLEEVLYFTPDSAVLTAETRSELDRLVSELRRYPAARIEINGHCAPHGTEQGRQELSELRAQGVADYLRQRGIDLETAEVRGLGAREPVSMADDKQHLNRRVEIFIRAGE